MIKKIAISGMIAALYAALTVALSPLSFGPVQFRVAEALTILPFFMPCSKIQTQNKVDYVIETYVSYMQNI